MRFWIPFILIATTTYSTDPTREAMLAQMNRELREMQEFVARNSGEVRLDALVEKASELSRISAAMFPKPTLVRRDTRADKENRWRRKIDKLFNAGFKMYKARWSRGQITRALLNKPYSGSPRVIGSILAYLANIDERNLPLREKELGHKIMTRTRVLREVEGKTRDQIVFELELEGFPVQDARDAADYHLHIE